MVDVSTPVLTHWAASDVNVNRAMSYQMTTSTVKVYMDTYNMNSYNVPVVVQESIYVVHSIPQSCAPVLEAPPNGEMKCDSQTVGGTCAFSCDEGYTLRGGASRTCLPSLQWAEPPAICDPPMCPELVPPENGFVLFPCTREEGDVCRVVCAHGYQLVGPSNQTCERDVMTDSLVWSEAPECMGEFGIIRPSVDRSIIALA